VRQRNAPVPYSIRRSLPKRHSATCHTSDAAKSQSVDYQNPINFHQHTPIPIQTTTSTTEIRNPMRHHSAWRT